MTPKPSPEPQTLQEAADAYAKAWAKLPATGMEFRGPEDADNFTAAKAAFLSLERIARRQKGPG